MATSGNAQNEANNPGEVDLQVNTKAAPETGCFGLTSKHESNQVRVLRGCCGPLADCCQSYQQFRWTILLCCNGTAVLPIPCVSCGTKCQIYNPRMSISDALWLIFIIFAQIMQVRDSFSGM